MDYTCDNCKSRHTWDCDNGWNRHKSCDEFELDFNTLNNKQKKTIQRILDGEDGNRDGYY